MQKIYSRVVKNRNFFLYFRVRGKAQHSDPPVTFYWKYPPGYWAIEVASEHHSGFFQDVGYFITCLKKDFQNVVPKCSDQFKQWKDIIDD